MSRLEEDHARYRALNTLLRSLFSSSETLLQFLSSNRDPAVAIVADFIPTNRGIASTCANVAQEMVRRGLYRFQEFAAFYQHFGEAREGDIRAAAEACGVSWESVHAGSRRLEFVESFAASRGVDVVIVTALQAELDALLALDGGWEERTDGQDFAYFYVQLERAGKKPLRIAAATSGELGRVSAAVRAQTLQQELKPRCLAMCGICAGVRDRVALGDVIVADRVFDHDAGKRTSKRFEHDIKTFNLPPSWRIRAERLASSDGWKADLPERRPVTLRWQRDRLMKLMLEQDGAPLNPREHPELWRDQPGWPKVLEATSEWVESHRGKLTLTEAGRDWADDYFLHSGYQIPPDPPLQAHIGPIAVGAAVEADGNVLPGLKPMVRKVLGLEMELSGIATVAANTELPALLVKAVVDFADAEKDDQFSAFACEASARFTLAFLCEQL
ncbi:MAG: nucleoside phosphorylase [Myxococcota bacterium]